jgi:phospholipid N-methyltransferase
MFRFIKEFVKHPRKVGAIAPSAKATCIVEYGPGLGSFTRTTCLCI